MVTYIEEGENRNRGTVSRLSFLQRLLVSCLQNVPGIIEPSLLKALQVAFHWSLNQGQTPCIASPNVLDLVPACLCTLLSWIGELRPVFPAFSHANTLGFHLLFPSVWNTCPSLFLVNNPISSVLGCSWLLCLGQIPCLFYTYLSYMVLLIVCNLIFLCP